jgi:hypothetical protein
MHTYIALILYIYLCIYEHGWNMLKRGFCEIYDSANCAHPGFAAPGVQKSVAAGWPSGVVWLKDGLRLGNPRPNSSENLIFSSFWAEKQRCAEIFCSEIHREIYGLWQKKTNKHEKTQNFAQHLAPVWSNNCSSSRFMVRKLGLWMVFYTLQASRKTDASGFIKFLQYSYMGMDQYL